MNKYFLLILLISAPATLLAQKETLVIPNGMRITEGATADTANQYLYTYAGSKCLMWERKSQRQLYTFSLEGDIQHISVSADGSKLLIIDGYANVFSTVSGKLLYKSNLVKGSAGTFSEDGKLLWLFNENYITSLDAETGKTVSQEEVRSYFGSSRLFNAGNGELVFTNDYFWQVYSTNPLKLLYKFEYEKIISHEPVFIAAAGTLAYLQEVPTGSYINLYNYRTGKKLKSVTIPQLSEYAHLFASLDNNQLAVALNAYNPPFYLVNGNSGAVEKKSLDKLTILPPFFGKKGSLLVHAGYASAGEAAADSICYYDLNVTSGKVSGKYRRSIPPILSLTVINDSNKVNFNGKMTFDLSKLRGKKERRATYKKPQDAADDGRYILNTNNGEDSLFINETSTGLRVFVKSPPNHYFKSGMYFISKDGSKVYFGTRDEKTLDEAFYQYDVKTKVNKKLVDMADMRASAINSSRTQIAYVDNDAGKAKKYLKVFDLAANKNVFTQTLEETDDPEKSIEKSTLAWAPGDASVMFVGGSGARIYNPVDGKISYEKNLDFLGDNKIHYEVESGLWGDDRFYSSDGRYTFKRDFEETIAVIETATQKKIGTLYMFNSGEYVFVDEFGRFDGSEAGIKQLYYLKNRNVIPLDLVYEKYYTPNLYQRLTTGEIFPPIPDEALAPAPNVKISYAALQRNLLVDDDMPTYQNTTGAAEITVSANAPESFVDEIRVFHNGKIVTLTSRNLIVADDNKERSSTKKYKINLLPGNNSIRAVALNAQRTESRADEVAVIYNGSAQTNIPTPAALITGDIAAVDKTATLHLVVVGINAYDNNAMSLNYALADATAFKTELERDARNLLANTKTYFITDREASKAGIVKAFSDVQVNAKPQDIFVFYYAGHGVIGTDKEFYLVPKDVSDLKNVQQELLQKGIPAKLLQQYAIDIPAQKQLFILDACQSAGAFEKLLTADGEQQKNIAMVARSTGTHWIAASGAQQFANEFSALGHGAFTYVLLQALKGEASANKMITVNGLKNFLQIQVPALMKKYNGTEQFPASYGFGLDFPVELEQ